MFNFFYYLALLAFFHCSFSSPVTGPTCTITKFSEVAEACRSCSKLLFDDLLVPAGVTLKLNLTDGATVIFRGNISFGFKNWLGPLVTINGTGITMVGEIGSFFDGRGQEYWDGFGGWTTEKPQFFTIQAFHSIFRNVTVYDSPIDVVQATNAVNVTFDNWNIDNSKGDKIVIVNGTKRRLGHNTDGFDVWNSTDVIIQNSKVINQDDCVAVRCGANILVRNMTCSGSHGLSISVGFSKDSVALNTLTNVTFEDSYLPNGQNGIHIKTHNDGCKGSLSNVVYRRIGIHNAENFGIEIQQNYPEGELNSNIPITNLTMNDVVGSVTGKGVPVFIRCAEGACQNFNWSGVVLEGKINSTCNFKPNGYDC